eukprot:TRINITY_DN71197_c0_g1_i1.p1 TRINITY_DN71197_c0_g1~~TRINITY_DN71197_c0_g1_i1.p1  ORF type:complete len:391 (-),score=92.21 TRINITY_DN71197_c0_g1_i1:122-1294(-)
MAYSSCSSADEADGACSDSADEASPPAAPAGECDDLGFLLPSEGSALGAAVRAYARQFAQKAQRRRERFEARRRKLASGGWSDVPKKALKALLRKGVPQEHRGEVWWDVLGCADCKTRARTSYAEYLGMALPHRTSEEIERDLHRTFPGHPTFQAEEGRQRLRRVLHAFAKHSPRVLYCQGLNYIAGLFLLILGDEERSFWALACAVDRLGVEGYYVQGMQLLRADIRVLESLLDRRCQAVARRLKEQGVDLLSICSEWYITWFAKALPVATTLRVWDTLFFEGYKVLFRIAIGVFKQASAEILRCADFESLMEHAKEWPRSMVAHNELSKASFGGISRLRREDLRKLRDAAVGEVEREDEAQRQRLRAREEALAAAAAAKASMSSRSAS